MSATNSIPCVTDEGRGNGTSAQRIAAAIHAEYLRRGGTAEKWAAIRQDPRRFNRVWRRLLNLPDGTSPPPADLQTIDPATGEDIAR